jgi:hypothetical protein
MPIEEILIYLAITTFYGWLMYRRGERMGTIRMGQLLIDAKVVKNKQALKDIIEKYFAHIERRYDQD